MTNHHPKPSELDLLFQKSKCLSIAIAGTNGKSTTAELVERVLTTNHRKTVLSGHRARPVCSVVEQTRHLDFLILQADASQLAAAQFFRPAVAVLTNLAPNADSTIQPFNDLTIQPFNDSTLRFDTPEKYIRATAALLRNQQPFDWAIIQSEALAQLCELNLPIPAKLITFSAEDHTADLYLNRGLLISRLPNWSGPLLDIDHCQLRGPHNAENLMAALAVGHVLRLPLDSMVDPLKTYSAGAHRFEALAEIGGVQFINDAKSSNTHSLEKAVLACRPGSDGQPNVILISSPHVPCPLSFGPAVSSRVKRALLLRPDLNGSSEKIRSSWSLFTSCAIADSLIEAVTEAISYAACGDVVLFSPACSSQDSFGDFEKAGERFCQTVKSICRGITSRSPNMQSEKTITE